MLEFSSGSLNRQNVEQQRLWTGYGNERSKGTVTRRSYLLDEIVDPSLRPKITFHLHKYGDMLEKKGIFEIQLTFLFRSSA